MFIDARRCLSLLATLLCATTLSARQQTAARPAAGSKMVLDVVVSTKSGSPVNGLQQQDFTLLDNKAPQTITSFQAVDGRQASIRVVIVIDAVNAGYSTVAFEHDQLDKLLRAEGGNLAHPTSLVVLTDTGVQVLKGFSSDGNELSASLDQYAVGLRNFRRGGGVYDAEELFQISLSGLHDIAAQETSVEGRKAILWISPGWPLLSGPGIELDNKDQQQFYADIVGFSAQFVQGNITLYNIDPLGAAQSGPRSFYWQEFAKGVGKPSQVQLGNLSLQVLASQTGGLVLTTSNDLAALLRQSYADLGAYYEIAFDTPPADPRNPYHHLEVRVAKPGVTTRTRQGYYLQR